jgi:hypothetical protein
MGKSLPYLRMNIIHPFVADGNALLRIPLFSVWKYPRRMFVSARNCRLGRCILLTE